MTVTPPTAKPPTKLPLRCWVRVAHLWAGVILGLWLVMLGLTGSALVYQDSLRQVLEQGRRIIVRVRQRISPVIDTLSIGQQSCVEISNLIDVLQSASRVAFAGSLKRYQRGFGTLMLELSEARIYFRSNRGDRWQIWRVSANGGSPQPVTTGDGIVPQESPDGRWVYYTRGDEDGLWRVPPSGGAETEVLTQPPAGYWGYWQITARGIFYLDHSGSSSEVRVYDPETKKNSVFATLKDPPPPYAGLSVSAQGTFILMTDQRDADRHATFVEAQP